MQTITTIGLDIAKAVFQVHGVDAGGQVLIRRQLKRRQVLAFFQRLPSCLVGIEACASSHHWSRELECGQLPRERRGTAANRNVSQRWLRRVTSSGRGRFLDAHAGDRR